MSSFPAGWVDRIFAKLSVTYGRDFVSRWEGIEVADIKEDWRHELSGFERFPKSIAHALENLPDKPPTVLEFRTLCRRAPDDAIPRLEAPAANRELMQAELAKAREILARPKDDPRAWARRIVDRKARGERVDRLPLQWAIEALRGE